MDVKTLAKGAVLDVTKPFFGFNAGNMFMKIIHYATKHSAKSTCKLNSVDFQTHYGYYTIILPNCQLFKNTFPNLKNFLSIFVKLLTQRAVDAKI